MQKWWLWPKQRLVAVLVEWPGEAALSPSPFLWIFPNLYQRQKSGVVISPCWAIGSRVPELPSPGCAAKSTAVFVMSLISSLLKTKCLWILLQQRSSHLSAASHSHYPPALPVGCEESCWRKDERAISLRKESSFRKKIELKHILSLLIKYMPVLYFRKMQINLLLLCSA